MGKLNTKSDYILTIIQCSIKSSPDEFKKWKKIELQNMYLN